MPPRVSSIPQPCPAVSPDQMNDSERRSAGAVRKCPTTGSLMTFSAAKSAGRLRVEGKDYEVREGDILHVRFAV